MDAFAPPVVPADYVARGIVKAFAGVRVLHGVDFAVRPGVVHGLVGHNGAGKSTLLKILAGAARPDAGELRVGGHPVHLESPRSALDQGIACVYQELRLIPQLSVTQNLFLGREVRGRGGLQDEAAMRRRAARLLDEHHLRVDPRTPVRELSHPDKQLIEVIANLDRNARFLFLDEPTTALAGQTAAGLLRTVRRTAAGRGVGVVLVSHNLAEVFGVCDELTVLSNGRVVLHGPRTGLTPSDVIAAIVGDAPRDSAREPRPAGPSPGPAAGTGTVGAGAGSRRAEPDPAGATAPRLVVRNLRGARLRAVSLTAHAGEVLGVYGLVGSGRTRFCRTLYGLEPALGGEVRLDGQPYRVGNPREAMARGVAYLTEERKRDGFVPRMSGLRNVILPVLRRYRGPTGWVDHGRAERDAGGILERLGTKGRLDQPVLALSGGNQQKVLFGRVIGQEARLVLLDEPTKGVDIGAKADIYAIVRALAKGGQAVVMVSSEEEELLGVADRITVFRHGICDGATVPAREASSGELRRWAWTGGAAGGG